MHGAVSARSDTITHLCLQLHHKIGRQIRNICARLLRLPNFCERKQSGPDTVCLPRLAITSIVFLKHVVCGSYISFSSSAKFPCRSLPKYTTNGWQGCLLVLRQRPVPRPSFRNPSRWLFIGVFACSDGPHELRDHALTGDFCVF